MQFLSCPRVTNNSTNLSKTKVLVSNHLPLHLRQLTASRRFRKLCQVEQLDVVSKEWTSASQLQLVQQVKGTYAFSMENRVILEGKIMVKTVWAIPSNTSECSISISRIIGSLFFCCIERGSSQVRMMLKKMVEEY